MSGDEKQLHSPVTVEPSKSSSVRRSCAVCGGRSLALIYRQKFAIPSVNAFHAGYDVVACNSCGFAFADNAPDQNFLDEYYRAMTKKAALLERRKGCTTAEPAFLIKLHENSRDNILRHASSDDRVLDIGCYTGSLLSLLREAGIGDVHGLDPSPYAASVAAEQYGLNVTVGSLFDDLALGKFDLIILSHVLEHIALLPEFLSRVYALLEPRGRIYIEVPDAMNFFLTDDPASPCQIEHQEPFLQFSVEHVNYFTARSLENLLTRNGFEKVSIEPQTTSLAVLASVFTPRMIRADPAGAEALTQYVIDSQAALKGVMAILESILSSGAEVLVWGAGAHAQMLLASSSLASIPIRAFIDSDPGYHGGTLVGSPIVGPGELLSLPPLPIVIASRGYQDEIAAQIVSMNLPNPVHRLYVSTES